MALQHHVPDRVPLDLLAVGQVWDRLIARLGLNSRQEVMERLGIDCRVISYDQFCSPPAEVVGDAAVERRRLIEAPFDRRRVAQSPTGWHLRRYLASAQPDSLQRVRSVRGAGRLSIGVGGHGIRSPAPTVGPIPRGGTSTRWDRCSCGIDGDNEYHIRYRIGSVFETAWSLRGFEQFLTDLVAAPAMADAIMDRITQVHLANLEQVMHRAGARIDMLYFYDDLATQIGMFISPRVWRLRVRPFHKQLCVRGPAAYGRPIMYHSCGAIGSLVPDLVEMGIGVFEPITARRAGWIWPASSEISATDCRFTEVLTCSRRCLLAASTMWPPRCRSASERWAPVGATSGRGPSLSGRYAG